MMTASKTSELVITKATLPKQSSLPTPNDEKVQNG